MMALWLLLFSLKGFLREQRLLQFSLLKGFLKGNWDFVGAAIRSHNKGEGAKGAQVSFLHASSLELGFPSAPSCWNLEVVSCRAPEGLCLEVSTLVKHAFWQ